MSGHKTYFFSDLISFAGTGYSALNEQTREEVRAFIMSQQNGSGGFTDRGGVTDAYYSLFGFFLCRGLKLNESETRLKGFIKKEKKFKRSLISLCCNAIIEKETGSGPIKKFSRLSGILFTFLTDSGGMSNSYVYFMVLLTLDAYGLNNSITRLIIRLFLRKIKIDDVTCPVQAARLIVRLNAGLDAGEDLEKLKVFFDNERGFKAFHNSQDADLLSTAVALFALRTGDADLLPFRHCCLQLLQENYHEGAFVAGNGDNEKDTEYTFYGLLALGILAS
jgi:hypothetical protein